MLSNLGFRHCLHLLTDAHTPGISATDLVSAAIAAAEKEDPGATWGVRLTSAYGTDPDEL